MKVNRLLSEIIKGLWLIDVHQIELYAPIINRILSGEGFTAAQTEQKALMQIVDGNGSTLKKNDAGELVIPKGSFANVFMHGEIIKYGDMCTYGADEIVNALYHAQSFKNVDATLLHIDGPGGSVSAIGPFRDFAKHKTKPIIGLADQALSLHYWAAAQVCDYIIADNDVSARFGSIGVVSSFVDARPVMEEKGYKFHEIYPPESKDKNQVFKLALEGKYDAIKKEILSPLAIKFQNAVKANRPNLKEETGVLTGKTFDADNALGLGLIDAIGGYSEAIEKARKLAFQHKITSSLNN